MADQGGENRRPEGAEGGGSTSSSETSSSETSSSEDVEHGLVAEEEDTDTIWENREVLPLPGLRPRVGFDSTGLYPEVPSRRVFLTDRPARGPPSRGVQTDEPRQERPTEQGPQREQGGQADAAQQQRRSSMIQRMSERLRLKKSGKSVDKSEHKEK